MKLKDKVAIITGGSKGVGKAIAMTFAKEDACVTIASRTNTELIKIEEEIERTYPHKVLTVVADISKPLDAKRIVKLTTERFGKINILVNNAAIQNPIGPFIDNDMGEWIKTININLIGTVRMIKLCLPYMISQRSGKIINLSGGGAVSSRPNFSAYGTSKAAIVRFTETLAEELRIYNIDVNSIAPGAVNTKMTEEIVKNKNKAGIQEYILAKKQLAEGGADPQLVASLALFLASEESNGLSGRLISAVWDDWQNLGSKIKSVMKTDAFTVRRIKEDEVK